jgi:hypothetical protein
MINYGHFLHCFKGIEFIPLDKSNIDKSIKVNLNQFIKLLKNLDPTQRLVGLSEETPFFDVNNQDSPLGNFEKELKEIGKICKEKSIRICTVVGNPVFGLASDNPENLIHTNSLLKYHSEFYDLARMDYQNLIFIPFGKLYLCDYEIFYNRYLDLPSYIQNRIGICDIDNFTSMVVAHNQRLPWLLKLYDALQSNEEMFKKSKISFANFGLAPNVRPLVLTHSKTLPPMPGFVSNYCFDLLLIESLCDITTTSKLKLKRGDNGTASNISRSDIGQNKSAKKTKS